ncbi:MAG: M60 family metallopeptidase [Rikenellaceae bacterium]|nr:M60 family metallopeptidase [Rikenellaceae bacterium]
MKLNKFFGLMLTVAAFIGMSVSCTPEEKTQGGDETPYLEVEADTLYLGYEANEDVTFLVNTHSIMWDCSAAENDWCSLTPVPSQGGGYISVTVTANNTGADRELVVTVTNGDLADQFVVKQSYNEVTPATEIKLETTEYVLERPSTTLKLAVEANGGYEVVVPEDCNWVSSDGRTEKGEGLYEEALYISENFGNDERSVVVTLKSLNASVDVSIKQWGKDDLRLSKSELLIGYVAGRDSIQVTSPSEYTVSVEAADGWLTYNKSLSEASADGWVYFDYSENAEDKSREAVVTVKTSTSTKSMTITQVQVSNAEMPEGDEFKEDLYVKYTNVTSSNGQNSAGSGITRLYDGNTISKWYSNIKQNENAPELVFEIDASELDCINYFKYVPVTTNDGNNLWGRWGKIDLYYTVDGTETKYGSYDFEEKGTDQTVEFDPALPNTVSKFRIVINSSTSYVDSKGTEYKNVASASEAGFYQYNPEMFQALDYFTDWSLSELKESITLSDVMAIKDPFYRTLAEQIFYGTYDDEFRVCEFKAYPRPERDYEIFRDKPFSVLDNVTGMYVEKANTPQYIYLDEDYGLEIYVRVCDQANYETTANPMGTGPDSHRYDYKIQKGRNVIVPAYRGQMYILAFDDENYDKIPPMKAHFVNSGVNGYLDYNKHTVEDVHRIFMLAPSTKEPRFDMIGDDFILNFEKAQYLKATFNGNPRDNAQRAFDLMEVYDSVTKIQERIQGHYKYAAQGLQRTHRNRMLFMGSYSDAFGYSSWYHTGYSAAMSADVVNPTKLWNKKTTVWNNGVVGAIWGIAHELGHSSQTDLFTWQGMAEVSNNLMCAITQNYVYGLGLGRTTMNYNDHFNKGMRDMAKRWVWDFDKDGKPYERPMTHHESVNNPSAGNIDGGVDPTTQLMPFYQLFLYYHVVLGNNDFYPDFYELCRVKYPALRAAYPNHDEFQSAIALEYMKSISEAAGEDLSDFACEWGIPGVNPAMGINPGTKVNHYGQAFFMTTKEQVEASVAACQKFPKPKMNPLYIHDDNLDLYRNPQPVTAGTHTVDDRGKFTMTGWANVVAWVLHDPNKVNENGEKGRDVAVIECNNQNGGGSFTYNHYESRYMINDAGTDYKYNNGSSYASNDKGTMRSLERVSADHAYTKTLQLYAVDAYGKRYASQSNK